jgi:hypothetical protein
MNPVVLDASILIDLVSAGLLTPAVKTNTLRLAFHPD